MWDNHGGGGTRTPKGLRPPHFECGALPIRLRLQLSPLLRLAVCVSCQLRLPPRGFEYGRFNQTRCPTLNRGARIRTGDLCDPNAALYRTEPRPDTDGVGLTSDSLPSPTVVSSVNILIFENISAPQLEPGFESRRAWALRTEWDSNPRGLSPTRFPIVRLKPLGHPSRYLFDASGTEAEWD